MSERCLSIDWFIEPKLAGHAPIQVTCYPQLHLIDQTLQKNPHLPNRSSRPPMPLINDSPLASIASLKQCNEYIPHPTSLMELRRNDPSAKVTVIAILRSPCCDWLTFFFVVVVNLFIWFWFFTLFENAVVENVAGLSQWQFSHGRVHSFPPTWSHCCRVSRTRTSCCRSAINYRYIFAINSYILTTYYHRIESCSIVIISMTLQQRNGSCKLTSQSIQSYHQL